MDKDVIRRLGAAGIETTFEKRLPSVPIPAPMDAGARSAPPEGVVVLDGEAMEMVTLKSASELFTGVRRPPDFSAGPTPEYMLFFFWIERAAADYCRVTGERVRDEEFERIYGDLRRRPDGRSEHPLHAHLQRVLRLYLSLHDVSEAEYEAVLRRLQRSARTFAMGPTSANYLDRALAKILG
jgi:hypothetical protein